MQSYYVVHVHLCLLKAIYSCWFWNHIYVDLNHLCAVCLWHNFRELWCIILLFHYTSYAFLYWFLIAIWFTFVLFFAISWYCKLFHIDWILVDSILLHTAELYQLADSFLSCMSVSIVFKLNQLWTLSCSIDTWIGIGTLKFCELQSKDIWSFEKKRKKVNGTDFSLDRKRIWQ